VPKKLTVEDILSDELKREMNLDTKTFVVLDDWDSVMHARARAERKPEETAETVHKDA
jgi:hypothetical protein